MNLLELSLVCFGGGSTYVPPVADTSAEDAAAKAAAEEAAKKEQALAKKRMGRRSTILTSGTGLGGSPVTTSAALTGTKTKLGQ